MYPAQVHVSKLYFVENFLLICFQRKSPPPQFVANPDTSETPVSPEINKPSGERTGNNTYTEGLVSLPLFSNTVQYSTLKKINNYYFYPAVHVFQLMN